MQQCFGCSSPCVIEEPEVVPANHWRECGGGGGGRCGLIAGVNGGVCCSAGGAVGMLPGTLSEGSVGFLHGVGGACPTFPAFWEGAPSPTSSSQMYDWSRFRQEAAHRDSSVSSSLISIRSFITDAGGLVIAACLLVA